MEWFKDLSDKLILGFLHVTSSFGKELTAEGRREQQHCREQRLRNLKGLSIRWQQRRSGTKS
jgi:hypothetical protein